MQYFVSATCPEPYMVNRRQTVRLPRKQTPPTHSEQTAKSVALAKSRSQSIRGGTFTCALNQDDFSFSCI